MVLLIISMRFAIFSYILIFLNLSLIIESLIGCLYTNGMFLSVDSFIVEGFCRSCMMLSVSGSDLYSCNHLLSDGSELYTIPFNIVAELSDLGFWNNVASGNLENCCFGTW